MRKGVAAALGAGAVAAGSATVVLKRRQGAGAREVATGTFRDGTGYARLGSGSKSLLWVGGPSVGAPRGLYLTMMRRLLRAFARDGYTVWIVGLKPHQPGGYTVADMAQDLARLIADEFDGKVDLVVGDSTGGMIGFYLAARHPESFGHVAIVVAGYTMTEAGKAANLEYANRLSEGRKVDAAEALVTLQYPDIPRPWMTRLLAAGVARVSFASPYDTSDVVVTAEAVNACDCREVLPAIQVPVLLVGGDRDRFFSKGVYQRTAELIPGCTLKLYVGKDHVGAMMDKRLPGDVLAFVRQTPRVR